MKKLKNKIFKEDDDKASNYLEDQFNPNKLERIEPILKTKKEDIRQLEEFIHTKRPKDPYKDLNPLTSKVDITPVLEYRGSSTNDVFQQRRKDRERIYPVEENPFLEMPIEL